MFAMTLLGVLLWKRGSLPSERTVWAFSMIASMLLLPRIEVYDLFFVWPALLILEKECTFIHPKLRLLIFSATHVIPLLLSLKFFIMCVPKNYNPILSYKMAWFIFNPTPLLISVLFLATIYILVTIPPKRTNLQIKKNG